MHHTGTYERTNGTNFKKSVRFRNARPLVAFNEMPIIVGARLQKFSLVAILYVLRPMSRVQLKFTFESIRLGLTYRSVGGSCAEK